MKINFLKILLVLYILLIFGCSKSPTDNPPSDNDPLSFIDSGQNLGDGRSFSIALGDIDQDGDLDAIVTNYTQASKVLRAAS